jgi:ABC-type xylose transport system permease subunit
MWDTIIGIIMWMVTITLYFQRFPHRFPTEIIVAFCISALIASLDAFLVPSHRRIPSFFCCTSCGVMLLTISFITLL